MAEVEALLNRSLTKRTVKLEGDCCLLTPAAQGEASAIESHREGLKESLSAIESQHQVRHREWLDICRVVDGDRD